MAKKAKAATPVAVPVAKKTKAAKQAAVKAEAKRPPPKKVCFLLLCLFIPQVSASISCVQWARSAAQILGTSVVC
jgi:hypothetical protein